jgi:predicted MPP superfamily phosphohydrolase
VVRELDLALPHWPVTLDGLRLALVSDLHAGGPQIQQQHVARVVRRTLQQRADLIAVLGDVIDVKVVGGAFVSPDAIGRELAALEAPLGVFGVLGNHDWHSGHGLDILRALREAGITVLENASIAVPARDTTLHVAGLADAHTRMPDVYKALREIPAGDPVLLLSHNPDAFPQVPPRVALTVSGHTHGGQVDVPLIRKIMIPSRFGDRYAHGHVVENGRHLYVTSGVGTSRWPIRLRRPPEIVVLTLRA